MKRNLVFQNGSYVYSDAHVKDGCYLSLRFSGIGACARIHVALDSPDRVVMTVSAVPSIGFPEEDVTWFQLKGFEGIHTLYFTPAKNMELLWAEIHDADPRPAYAPVPDDRIIDMQPFTWSAEDELGRKVADAEDVRGRRKDRQVGIFYWTWRDHNKIEPLNTSKILQEYPAAEYNREHPAWQGMKFPGLFSWNEPLYGHYRNRDPYVIRRHAVLLANAGVDAVFFDCTNGCSVFKESYEPLLEGFRKAREDGINAPKFAFILNLFTNPTAISCAEESLRGLYQDIYSIGKYRDLWYLYEGKPLIMAYPEALPQEGSCPQDTTLLDEIRNFFTFRPMQPSYGRGPVQSRMWGWLEKAPQHKFGCRPDGSCEMMTVGVAQNCNDRHLVTRFNDKDTYGRSYTYGHGHKLLDENSYKYGYNFQEQWDRAIDCDPDFVFITGWNEWLMGGWGGEYDQHWLFDPDSTQIAFVDQYDLEHSRDIEPDRDGIRDNYYLQMCSNIRRYKGASARQQPSGQKSIKDFSDFEGVTPVYRSELGTTVHRDFPGLGSRLRYTNDTGRNNIISAKVARDETNVYFLAECAEEITAKEGENHMTLYLNLNRSRATGWEGYDLAVGRKAAEGDWVIIEEYDGHTAFREKTKVPYVMSGRQIMYKLPRELFGDGPLEFEFKWADNVGTEDIIDFYCDGDVAPAGRFNYVYKENGFPVKEG